MSDYSERLAILDKAISESTGGAATTALNEERKAVLINMQPPRAHYVCGFCFDKRGDVVLVQKRTPEAIRWKYTGVGGRVEPGEDVQAAMVREWAEETGADPVEWRHFAALEYAECKIECFVAHIPDRLWEFLKGRDRNDVGEFLAIRHARMIPRESLVPDTGWLLEMARDPASAFFSVGLRRSEAA